MMAQVGPGENDIFVGLAVGRSDSDLTDSTSFLLLTSECHPDI